MTTLVSLATRDCIVIGCDSLATSSQSILNPHRILSTFFDDEGALKLDGEGRPLLDHGRKLIAFSESLPINQLPNVTKLFPINGFPAGLLFAGIAGIGAKSVKNLVEEFTEASGPLLHTAGCTILTLAEALSSFLNQEFETAFAETPAELRPTMEVLLSGYSRESRRPEIIRIRAGQSSSVESELPEGQFRTIFGGQHDVIGSLRVSISKATSISPTASPRSSARSATRLVKA